MENKTTSELLDLLWKIDKEASKKDDFDWDKYEEVYGELRNREPFKGIIGTKDDVNDPSLEEKVDDLVDDIKLLKRHKHDEHNGDVLVRI